MATLRVNPLQTLSKQFKALMSLEASLSPEARKCHQWQLLAVRGKMTYIILKGGANTVGYRILTPTNSNPEWQYVMPSQMLDVLSTWLAQKHIGYKLVQGSTVLKKSRDIRALLAIKPKHTSRIVGVHPEGKEELLYEWHTGVFNADWKPAKSKRNTK